ncbi:MAG: TIGR00725 family protein, partial [Thaumarchaeota archaeon]|nr:TIGR00725 family protein [Nitrososphaerota archaeon]
MVIQISVIGYSGRLCTKRAYEAAYQVGAQIAKAGAVVVNGGLDGVMEAAAKGAHDAGGVSIGIIPSEEPTEGNKYSTFVIPSGMGFMRNFLVVNSGDAVIIVGGGAGTLTEAAAAYQQGKPIIAVKGTGGVADEWAGRSFDERRIGDVIGASGPKEAVEKALDLAGE